MERRRVFLEASEREAVLGLWGVSGIGSVGLEKLEARLGTPLGALADVPVLEWLGNSGFPADPRRSLSTVTTLRELAAAIREAARAHRMDLCFAGDPEYPERLLEIAGAPPLLFSRGRVGEPRKKVAVVGSRHSEHRAEREVGAMVASLAAAGVCIVSGAADGMDRAAHFGALGAGGETWAFVASSLDELDPAQAFVARSILEGGGRVLSEYPPGTRAKTNLFPRRNRLISGVADVVLVARAGAKSGTMHTVSHALKQGRPLFAVPGDPWNPCAAGTLSLIRSGKARVCLGAEDVLAALGIVLERRAPPPPPGRTVDELPISKAARRAFRALEPGIRVLEEVQESSGLEPAELVSALAELELAGLAVQHPGRVYEKA